jgi:hypothetical protein
VVGAVAGEEAEEAEEGEAVDAGTTGASVAIGTNKLIQIIP